MFKKILLILVSILLIVIVTGLILPANVVVTRSVLINRPASLVYATVSSFQLFPKWSPWQDLDPNVRQSVEGPREGPGAKLIWSGNDRVGNGTQVITHVVPNESVDSDVDFGSSGGKSHIGLAREGEATRVTWTMTMHMGANPIGHLMGLAMDRMLGPDFAAGLVKLKMVVEAMPDVDIAGLSANPVDMTAAPVLLVTESSPPNAVAKAYSDGYTQIARFMAKNKLRQTAPPLGIEGAITPSSYSFDAGIPVDRGDVVAGDGVRVDKTYAGKALKTVHVGSYENMQQTHDKLLAFAVAHGYVRSGSAFWSFVDDPGKVPEAQLKTEIYAPVE